MTVKIKTLRTGAPETHIGKTGEVLYKRMSVNGEINLVGFPDRSSAWFYSDELELQEWTAKTDEERFDDAKKEISGILDRAMEATKFNAVLQHIKEVIADSFDLQINIKFFPENVKVEIILLYGNRRDFNDFLKKITEEYIPAGFLIEEVSEFSEAT